MLQFTSLLEKARKTKKGLSPIEASLSYNGERIYFSTGKYAKPSAWNKQMQMVKGNTQDAYLINDFLIELRNKVYKKETELMKRGYINSSLKFEYMAMRP